VWVNGGVRERPTFNIQRSTPNVRNSQSLSVECSMLNVECFGNKKARPVS
jgi:hypothetical protein